MITCKSLTRTRGVGFICSTQICQRRCAWRLWSFVLQPVRNLPATMRSVRFECACVLLLWSAGFQINVLCHTGVFPSSTESGRFTHSQSGHLDCSSSPHAFISLSFCFQSAAKLIKESMDKKFGSSWHVVIGEGFGFEVSHEVRNLLYMFFGGSLAVCVWKCSWCRFLPTQSPLWDIYTRGSVLTMQPYLTWDVCVWVWRGGVQILVHFSRSLFSCLSF